MSKSGSGKVTLAVAIAMTAWLILKWSSRIAFVLSVICILLMDVVMGAIALDKVIVSSPQISTWMFTIHIPVALLCTGFSMAATAIRMSMWEMLIHGKAQTTTRWLFLTAIAVVNTLIDLSAVPAIVFGESPTELFPSHFNGAYIPLALIVAVICTIDCYLTTMLLGVVRDYNSD